MNHPKQRHGNHTWDLVLHYYRCSNCGYILEDSNKFEPTLHHFVKEVVCPLCLHTFQIEKRRNPSWGPLLGNDPEIDE